MLWSSSPVHLFSTLSLFLSSRLRRFSLQLSLGFSYITIYKICYNVSITMLISEWNTWALLYYLTASIYFKTSYAAFIWLNFCDLLASFIVFNGSYYGSKYGTTMGELSMTGSCLVSMQCQLPKSWFLVQIKVAFSKKCLPYNIENGESMGRILGGVERKEGDKKKLKIVVLSQNNSVQFIIHQTS